MKILLWLLMSSFIYLMAFLAGYNYYDWQFWLIITVGNSLFMGNMIVEAISK